MPPLLFRSYSVTTVLSTAAVVESFAFEEQLGSSKIEQLSFEERLGLLLDRENTDRAQRRRVRILGLARMLEKVT